MEKETSVFKGALVEISIMISRFGGLEDIFKFHRIYLTHHMLLPVGD